MRMRMRHESYYWLLAQLSPFAIRAVYDNTANGKWQMDIRWLKPLEHWNAADLNPNPQSGLRIAAIHNPHSPPFSSFSCDL